MWIAGCNVTYQDALWKERKSRQRLCDALGSVQERFEEHLVKLLNGPPNSLLSQSVECAVQKFQSIEASPCSLQDLKYLRVVARYHSTPL